MWPYTLLISSLPPFHYHLCRFSCMFERSPSFRKNRSSVILGYSSYGSENYQGFVCDIPLRELYTNVHKPYLC